MIGATAGHVDHGKTALVRALTGIETDRLAEEKRRGLSIDLGFAYQPTAGGDMLGFVDVPGHERFIATMLAGVGAIDRALLVIAADEGPMPQTAEHLAILELLGIEGGAVALTKIDRIDETRRVKVMGALVALLGEGPLAGAPVFPVASPQGEGIAALRAWLEREAAALAPRAPCGNFRLAIDRCFTLDGAGLVVTGAVWSGTAQIGDSLVLSPMGAAVRVRGIHANNREAAEARAGERCALNIAGRGLSRTDIGRGDWLVAEPAHAPTPRLDGCIRVLGGERRVLRSRTLVHLYLGAAHVTARVHPLDRESIEPGETGLAQLVLDRPIGALFGDRFVLRDGASRHTVGGGRVIDPFAPARGRAKHARLAALSGMAADSAPDALAALLVATPDGVDLNRFACARNLTVAAAAALWRAADMVHVDRAASRYGLSPAHGRALKVAILAALGRGHEEQPERTGIEVDRLRRRLERRVPIPLIEGVVDVLAETGKIRRMGARLALADFKPTLPGPDQALWRRVRPQLASSAAAPVVHELAESLDLETAALRRFLQRAESLGLVARVSENRFLSVDHVRDLAAAAEALAMDSPDRRFTVAAYRDRAGIGRNLAIEVLEYFDRTGLTERLDTVRRLRNRGSDRPGRPVA